MKGFIELKQELIDLSEFVLLNKEQLKNDIKEDVLNFRSREALFEGLFRKVFDIELNKFIIQKLRLTILRETSMPYDFIYEIVTEEFLTQLTGNFFFDKNSY